MLGTGRIPNDLPRVVQHVFEQRSVSGVETIGLLRFLAVGEGRPFVQVRLDVAASALDEVSCDLPPLRFVLGPREVVRETIEAGVQMP